MLPETYEFASPGWATYIPSRKSIFRAHSHIGLAKLALSIHRDMNDCFSSYSKSMGLYQLAPNDAGKLVWKLHTEIKAGTRQEDYPEIWKPKTKPGGKDVSDV